MAFAILEHQSTALTLVATTTATTIASVIGTGESDIRLACWAFVTTAVVCDSRHQSTAMTLVATTTATTIASGIGTGESGRAACLLAFVTTTVAGGVGVCDSRHQSTALTLRSQPRQPFLLQSEPLENIVDPVAGPLGMPCPNFRVIHQSFACHALITAAPAASVADYGTPANFCFKFQVGIFCIRSDIAPEYPGQPSIPRPALSFPVQRHSVRTTANFHRNHHRNFHRNRFAHCQFCL